MNLKYNFKIAALVCASLMVGFTSCSESDADKDHGKTPRIEYVRYTDPASEHITSAFLGETVAFIGSNMGDVQEIWFNDKKALINPTMITSNSIVVTIPSDISSNVTDVVRLVTSTGKEGTCTFQVLVPPPVLSSLDNEWANPGDVVTLTGDYLVNDPEVPMEITFPNGVKVDPATMEFSSTTKVTFTVPQGAPKEGQIVATSRYGSGYSNFVYRDTRALLFDWDGTHTTATGAKSLALANGWRDGAKLITDSFDGIPALDGKYICFNGTKGDYNDMGEDNFSFNHWSRYDGEGHVPGLDPSSLFDAANFTKYCLKFEAFVPESTPWTICSLNAIFTSADLNNDNAYTWDDTYPRGMWTPWQSTGSYTTGGKWVTVTMPFTDFTYNRYLESAAKSLTADSFKGLTFIICWGPASELTSVPVTVAIDNIRIAPLEEEMPEDSESK